MSLDESYPGIQPTTARKAGDLLTVTVQGLRLVEQQIPGVTLGPWRRRLGDNRFRVFISEPSAAMSAALVIRDALRNEPAGRVAPEARRPCEPASGRNGHVRVCKVLGLFLSKLPIAMPTSQGQSARVKAAYPFLVKKTRA